MYTWDKEQLGTGKIGWELEWKTTVEEIGIGRVGIKIRIRKLEWIGSRLNILGIGKDINWRGSWDWEFNALKKGW